MKNNSEGVVELVSTSWLEEHLDDERLTIIDAQPNIHDYIDEHIPGAVYMNEGLLRDSYNGLPGTYVSPRAVEPTLRRLGVSNDIPAVVYTGKGSFKGWGDGLEQTMVAYSLSRFGQNTVYLLNGGLDKWKEEGKPLTKKYPLVAESDFISFVRENYLMKYDEFKAVKDDPDAIVLDARPPYLYEGQGPWIKPGHIPGAVNLPWASLMSERNPTLLKSIDEIKPVLNNKGITPDKMVICTCGTGREATNEFILFKWVLTYPRVKLYEGSFTEWVAYPENPTVTGQSPRMAEQAVPTY